MKWWHVVAALVACMAALGAWGLWLRRRWAAQDASERPILSDTTWEGDVAGIPVRARLTIVGTKPGETPSPVSVLAAIVDGVQPSRWEVCEKCKGLGEVRVPMGTQGSFPMKCAVCLGDGCVPVYVRRESDHVRPMGVAP